MTVDKERLLKPRLAEREVEVPGVGTVRVRSLSRSEVIRMGTLGRDGDFDGAETFALACGMVDPALAEHEAREWRRNASSDEVEPVLEAITQMSALGDDALKEAVHTFRGDPGTETGVPPGPHPGDDRDPAP